MNEHLYLNYPQYIQDHSRDFGILLMHNPDTKTGVLPQLEDITKGNIGEEKLILMLLPSAFSVMIACQIQILLTENPGHLSIRTSAQTSQGRQVSIEAGTHYLEQLQPEEIALLDDWCRRMLLGA